MILSYSKKIFGFSLSKTKNVFEAEDLSQEILINLYSALSNDQTIQKMDSFIYKVCFYTWSNYVRKNIKEWKVEKYEYLDCVDENIESNIKDIYIKIRQRISFLAGLNQKIITMYYYDQLTTKIIAARLNINENTVRTNLKRTKTKIKEKIEMDKKTLHYKPIKLNLSHSGMPGKNGCSTDLLGQNILYTCYQYPKSIEEIAEDLQVATCYLEDYLKTFVFVDWLKLKNNKYQTNFWFETIDSNLYQAKYHMNHINTIAVPLLEIVEKYYPRFKKIVNNDTFSDNSLKWLFTSHFINSSWRMFIENYQENNINSSFKMRKDGGNYILFGWYDQESSEELKDNKLFNYYANRKGMITKRIYGKYLRTLTTSILTSNLKLDSLSWNPPYDSYQIDLIYKLIENKASPTEQEKAIIAEYVKEEIVKVEDGVLKWNIVFLTKQEEQKLSDLLDEMIKEINEDIFFEYLKQYSEGFRKYIPKHLGLDMINYYSTEINITSVSLYHLYEQKLLLLPSRKEVKTASEWFYVYV